MAERPEYLTVPEVMARLRLGRTTVYEQARLYLATGGAEGIHCRRFGRSLRFQAAALDAAGADRTPEDKGKRLEPTRVRSAARKPSATRPPTRRTRRRTDNDPSTLPFTD